MEQLDRIATTTEPEAGAAAHVAVWDPFVRVFHWSLVAAVLVAALTGFLAGAPWIDLHVWAGTATAVLISARLIWGFLGGTYARFSAFLPRPGAVIAHVRTLFDGHGERHLGHNPLGALMILSLIATGLGLALTGVAAYGGILKSGPLAFAFSYATARGFLEIHELLAWSLLGLVAAHVAGALLESMRSRENLVRAMLTGRKQARPGDCRPPARRAWPLAAALSIVVLVAGAGFTLSALAKREIPGVPTAALDPVYVSECAACHVAYHPGLLPRDSWVALIDGLADHFGEDASLDDATTGHLRGYVMANAAQAWDTKPANRFTRVDPAAPFTITATPSWKRIHRDIPDTLFASKAVVARSNCNACHRDAASGHFYPGNIAIPKETQP
ncbi:MAG: cytochrome b/b6 domain-containing protein [Notoacmeibacter sp.]|nr:cytochrome b/b6 domain-containing protein [Notoacmeibacter sp.]